MIRTLRTPFIFTACLACLAGVASAAGGVREVLEGSIPLSSSDSIESLTRFSSTRLGVDIYDADVGQKHSEWTELTPQAMQNVLEAASIEGVPVRVADAGEEPPMNEEAVPSAASTSPTSSASTPPASSPRVHHHHVAHVAALPADPGPTRESGEKDPNSDQNRLIYLGYETLLSTYVYGLALPLAFGVTNPRYLVGIPLLAAPASFGVHLWLSRDMQFTEANLKGSLYMSSMAEYAATALPLAFASNFGTGYRGAALLGMAAYPLGLWYGYNLGNSYPSNPDELDTKFQFALGYAFFGFIMPTLYFEHPGSHSDEVLRIGLAQSVGMAVVGNFVSDYYQIGPNVAPGVPVGIATHVLLGALAGIEVASIADASRFQPWLGASLFGAALGLSEGVVFFHYNDQDNFDRARFSLLGTLGGAMMGTGIQLLVFNSNESAHAQKIGWSSFIVGGAWLGYWTTYELTKGMTEPASSRADIHRPLSAPSIPKWAFNPLPLPAPVMSRGEWASGWQIPGFSMHF